MKSKIFLVMLLLLPSLVQAEHYKFKAGSGVIEINEVESIGINSIYEYKFNKRILGTNTSVGLDAKLIGSDKGADFFLVKGGTGGSGCAELFSIIRVKGNQVTFTPSIPACGGLLNVELKKNVVIVKVLERDETTQTRYSILGSSVFVNGKTEMENEFSFLE